MTTSHRGRVARTLAAIAIVGLSTTTASFVVVRNDVNRLTRQRVDRPAAQAVSAVESLRSSVDQVLATANGVVAASGLDPHRFASVLGPDVKASSTLAGMALVAGGATAPRVVARVGDTGLLAQPRAALVSSASSTLIASHHDPRAFELGFAALVAHGDAAVYLEVSLPIATVGAPFVLASGGASPALVLGNVATTTGLTASNQPVRFAGRSLTLYVQAGAVPNGLFGISLPVLVLLVGLILTVIALLVGVAIVRRDAAVQHLGRENRALDQALEQQRVVERELRDSQERFRAILRDSPDIIVLYDIAADTCEVLNRAEILGHPLAVVAAPGGLSSLVDPIDRGEADAHWGRMRSLESEQVCESTLRLRSTNGETRYVRLRFSPLELGADAVPRLLGSLSDVTEQRTNELREAELEEALRRSQRLEAVGQLAGGVAHDFNNLLAAILASAELLSDYVPEGRPREYTAEIERSVMHGAALVRQLLTFAQRDHAEMRVIDLNRVIEGMEPLLRRSLGEHVQLQITLADCAVEVLADPTHIEQVILNLAVNARDAMPAGGVLWIATAIDPDDDEPENDRVVLSVTDTGTGIDPDMRARMFEPFVTSKDPGKGTGLGLSTVQNIVQSMNGKIDVHSKVGEGTVFEISFGRRYGLASDVEPSAASPAPAPGAGRHVLLVEDDTALRAALAHTLETNGFAVTAADRASDALQAVDQYTFDVLLTDAVMPGMSGPDLIDRLRSTHPALPMVLMSGYAPGVEGSHVGTAVQLRKPFTARELFAALDDARAMPQAAESR